MIAASNKESLSQIKDLKRQVIYQPISIIENHYHSVFHSFELTLKNRAQRKFKFDEDFLNTMNFIMMQVSELESALHKRHPDSIAALIAATAPSDHNDRESELRQHLDTVKVRHNL